MHDRVQVEAKVLPRYFNHSSFASLRRQLNYFSFVRLGKGRQRESTYVNENVVELDDILHLKRRSTTGTAAQVAACATLKARLFGDLTADPCIITVGESGAPVVNVSDSFDSSAESCEHRPKRRRQNSDPTPKTVSPQSASLFENNTISEDEEHSSPERCSVLDLTKPEGRADADVLVGCQNLLYLSSKRW